jgi:hypothetical protein
MRDADRGCGPGLGPGPGPAPEEVGAGGSGLELGVPDGEPGSDGPEVEGPRGEADADLEGRGDALGDFGRSVRSDAGGEVMGAACPIGAPGWVITPSPTLEITAHTSTAPTTTRTSQAEPAKA